MDKIADLRAIGDATMETLMRPINEIPGLCQQSYYRRQLAIWRTRAASGPDPLGIR
jgi:hypothetical protein